MPTHPRTVTVTLLGGALTAALTVALAGGCAADPTPQQVHEYQVEYSSYDSVADLFDRADAVVQGRVVADAGARDLNIGGDEAVVVTVFETEIHQAYKGEVRPGQTIEIGQLGGELDGTEYVDRQTVFLEPGSSYVLFLMHFPDDPQAPAALLNPHQSQYPLDDAGAPTSLPENRLELTHTDLTELSAGSG